MAGASWRDMVKDQVAVKAAETREKHNGASQTANISRVGFSVNVHPHLVRAAKRRGISISGYIRRATLAVVAMDLGFKATDLFDSDTLVTPPGGRGAPSKDLDGTLYGRWEVVPGEPDSPRAN